MTVSSHVSRLEHFFDQENYFSDASTKMTLRFNKHGEWFTKIYKSNKGRNGNKCVNLTNDINY